MLFGISAKAFQLQILNRDQALNLANRQHKTLFTLLPRRGRILDSNHKILTMNIDSDSIYVRPSNVTNAAGFVNKASQILGLPVAKTREMLNSGKSFIWLERLADDKVSEQFKEAGIEGVGFIKEAKRLYPAAYLSSHVLGYVGVINETQLKNLPLKKLFSGRVVGQSGIEAMLDDLLIGFDGGRQVEVDNVGRELRVLGQPVKPVPGHELTMTIDLRLQRFVRTQMAGKKGRGVTVR